MRGWLYIIRNGNLYKIGITKNIDQRMRQLKPDHIVSKLFSSDFKELERAFHKRYKNVRIPQTEYFRLDDRQIREIKIRISELSYPMGIVFCVFTQTFSILITLLVSIFLITSLFINDMNDVLFISLLCVEQISLLFSS